ncbi:DUF2206 domain-containing protein, partial [Chloroflexota bacterium]
YIGGFYAFFASIFLMSQTMFLWTPAEARGNLAVFFFALAIMVLFHDGITEFARRTLFIIFAASVILSHYTTTYLFFFVLLFIYVGTQVLYGIMLSRKKELVSASPGTDAEENTPGSASRGFPKRGDTMASGAISRGTLHVQPKRLINLMIVLLFFSMLLLWYMQVIEIPFTRGVDVVYGVLENLNRFYLEESRSTYVQAAFGRIPLETGIAQEIKFYVSWMTVAFIAIGVFTLIMRLKKIISIPNTKHDKSPFLIRKIEPEFLMLLISCCVILVLSIALPRISKAYGFTRTYFQMAVPLSICFVIGGMTIARYLKSRYYWVILLVLMPYFMCMTGTVYQISGVPNAVTLNSEGEMYNHYYIHDREIYAARHLEDYRQSLEVHADRLGLIRLRHEGLGEIGRLYTLSPSYHQEEEIGGYIYLRYYNIVDGKFEYYGEHHNMEEFASLFAGKNLIYANGGSEVWK